jgi:hypothetical protein
MTSLEVSVPSFESFCIDCSPDDDFDYIAHDAVVNYLGQLKFFGMDSNSLREFYNQDGFTNCEDDEQFEKWIELKEIIETVTWKLIK